MLDPNEAALLWGIAENHAADAPRLVYADWLEEHGDAPRAEFIRVQCELATAPTPELRRRERELLDAHRREWVTGFGVPLEEVAFDRGLIARARLATWDGGRFLDPATLPRLATVTELDLSELKLSDANVAAFANAARLPALRKLMLNDNQLTDAGAVALANAKGVPQLDEVYWFGNQTAYWFGNQGVGIGRVPPLGSRHHHITTIDVGQRPDGYCMSHGQTEMARRRFLRTELVPLVATYFEKYERLQSATLCVAQFWNDEADDAVHGELIVSELPEPDLNGVSFYDDNKKDVNVPNTRFPSEYGEQSSVVSIWEHGWDSNHVAIPLWAAFSPEGGSQHESFPDGYAPAVMFYRHGGYDILPMVRPHLDGVRPEWGWEGE